jgi:hypothetical protein
MAGPPSGAGSGRGDSTAGGDATDAGPACSGREPDRSEATDWRGCDARLRHSRVRARDGGRSAKDRARAAIHGIVIRDRASLAVDECPAVDERRAVSHNASAVVSNAAAVGVDHGAGAEDASPLVDPCIAAAAVSAIHGARAATHGNGAASAVSRAVLPGGVHSLGFRARAIDPRRAGSAVAGTAAAARVAPGA